MDFDVIEEPTKKKKKTDKQLIILSTILFVLSIILMLLYIFPSNKKQVVQNPPITQVQKAKLTIVDEDSNDRPIAVMIDNNIGDAKHAGLQESYINYEMIVEGGLTRIMAIFKDKDVALIGPVRSSRHYFLDYALESDAIYVHYGWSPYAEKDIQALNVNNINGMSDEPPFSRDSTQISPHNVFTTTTKIKTYLPTKNYSDKSNNWKLLNCSTDKIDLNEEFQNNENSNVISANNISMSYSQNENRSYIYDSENGYYLRSMNGKAHMDRATNAQLNYKNIIIMKVENKNVDNEGRQDLTTTGSGAGYYITNGFAVPIKWIKDSRNTKTKYVYENGNEIKVNDGNTFIQIVPLNSEIKIG